MQQAATAVATAHVGTLAPFTAAPKIPAVGGAGGPQREVFGFALASSLTDPTVGFTTWDFSLLSTVAFFGLHVQDDGTFANDSGLAVWNSSELTSLLTAAHSHGVKVVLTIIEQDFSPGTPHMCAAIRSANTTIANTVAQVKAKGVDGVNVDYEGLNGSCGTSDTSAARNAFTSFMAEMRTALPAGSYLSVDTYASSASDPIGFFDVPSLGKSADSFFVMAYDLEYSNYLYGPPGCPNFCLGPTAPLAGYYYNDTSTASQYAAAVPSSKVILGVPYYGRKSCVGSPVPNAAPNSAVIADAYLDASQEYTAPEVKYGSYAAHRDANDPTGQERWDDWVNTSLNCIRELYWDDQTSLGQKYALVNHDNLRGVGLWNLNYGGGSSELWGALSSYFACPVGITLPATESTTRFNVAIAAPGCNVASFDLQERDTTAGQGWLDLAPVPATAGSGTATVDTYAGHAYQFQARAHIPFGPVMAWSGASTQVAANATLSHPFAGLYTVDAYGGITPGDSAPLATSGSWNWKIIRGAHPQPGPSAPQGGLVLDGWGGMHPFGTGIKTLTTTAYWLNWDIARDFAWLPNGTGGYVLDGWGGLHPFAVNGAPMPPKVYGAPYWPSWDIARKIVIFSDGTGGYVLDGYGGVHAFGIGQPAPAGPTLGAYWRGWDIARGLVLIPGTRIGYVLDGWGGIHGFTLPGQAMPAGFANAPYWRGWDISRGLFLLATSTPTAPAGYEVDGYGGLHQIGSAPVLAHNTYLSGNVAVGVFGA